MLEKDLLNWIIECAERTGWLVKHVPSPMVADKRTGTWRPFARAAGLPDLFMLHSDPPRLIIAEVKGDKGKLSGKQREFLLAARKVAEANGFPQAPTHRCIGVYVWTPQDQLLIEGILKTKILI